MRRTLASPPSLKLRLYGSIEMNVLLFNLNVQLAITKGMQAVNLCSNKTLQFLTGGANEHTLSYHNGCKMVVAVVNHL